MDGTMVGDQVGLQGDMDRGQVDAMCVGGSVIGLDGMQIGI